MNTNKHEFKNNNMMKNDEKIISEYQWIPWRRYVLLLGIDNSKKKKISRLPRKDSAARVASRLSLFKGYDPEIFDTKTQQALNFEPLNL